MRHIENKNLTIRLQPFLGGKIAQITNRNTGREWLSHHPRLPWKSCPREDIVSPDAYVRLADLGGWDECCPTVGSCRYPLSPFQGVFLPDHGECWFQRPRSMRVKKDMFGVNSVWRGVSLPYELSRKVVLHPDNAQIQISYHIRSLGFDAFFLSWSAHPIFAIEPGMKLHLPDRIQMTIASQGSPLGERGTRFAWPKCGKFDLTEVTPAAGWAAKMFSDCLPVGTAELETQTGEKIRISWASENLPFRLGLWVNYGGWSGDGGGSLQNMGIEPCIGMPDRLDEAIEQKNALLLDPMDEFHWSVMVEVE